MNREERIKFGLASILYLIMDNYEPEENDNVDILLISICDFLQNEFGMSKDEIKGLVSNINVQIIDKAREKLLN